MSILYQNIPQLQNRYPDGQWEEILGGCDISLFLGCNDMTTATYFSGRSGEVTVGVASIRKNLSSMRMSDYVPDYSETSSVGKHMLLLPDEVLRFPLDQALMIIRGQKVLKVRKFDYSRHSEAKKLVLKKTESHMPEWRKREEEVFLQKEMKKEFGEREEAMENHKFQRQQELFMDNEKGSQKDYRTEQELKDFIEIPSFTDAVKGNDWGLGAARDNKAEKIERVEDLFADEW